MLCRNEVVACMGVYVIDIAITSLAHVMAALPPSTPKPSSKQVRLAIECDGPFHYESSGGGVNAATLTKRRILKEGGWSLVSVPHLEWPRKAAERKGYLLGMLEAAVKSMV